MDPSSSPSLPLLEDFGQRVDLTRRIREVLVNYPEGTTVLKELIQNADDAGATRVCLCLDRRSHGVSSLLSPELAQWQGPALLAYNDAVFTEDDFVSISRIGDSKKQSQAWKTGRFGVGFNSVYHLTDLPSFVSGKYAVLFDPQLAYLPNVSAANPGKRIDYISSSAINLYTDQFSPYRAFGCNMKKAYSGTLFRFPLRNSKQARVSRLSRQSYLENDIFALLSQLYEEAVFTMLFLKSIVSVEMYVWEAGTDEPKRLYRCSVSSPNEDTAWHRKALVRFSSSAGESRDWQRDSFMLDFTSESFLGTDSEKRICRYFIAQGLASVSSRIGIFASAAAKDYELHLLPWASVAACVSDSGPENNILKQGRAFCFLPLPVHTGLSVQVNAYFEISSNRRDVWYGADMDRGGKLRSDWNRLLLEDVVAPVFNDLLLGLQKQPVSTQVYYSLFPTGTFEEPWAILVKSIYKAVYNSQILYSEIQGGKWIRPAKAVIHDQNFAKSKELGEALVLADMPLVHLTKSIVDMFAKYYAECDVRMVIPLTVRNFLKGCHSLAKLIRSHKLVLLEYCLSDIDSREIGKQMNGLPLLPLANDGFGVISEAAQETMYFVCNELEYELLTVVHDRIVDRDIPSNLRHQLSQIAGDFQANISFIDAPVFLQFFPVLFPSVWEFKNRVSWDPDSRTADWFKLFWRYIGERSYDLGLFADWPILPSISKHLYRPLTSSKLINTEVLPSSMRKLLEKIGCKILDTKFGIEHRQLSLYVYDSTAGGVVCAIFETVSTNNNNQLYALFDGVSPDEKIELCEFLMDPKWYVGGSLSEMDIDKCRKLPIYRVFDGGYAGNYSFSDLSSTRKHLPPLGVPESLLSNDFVFSTSQSEEDILTRYYGLERMQKSIFYQSNALNKLPDLRPEVRDTVMLTILKELPQLCLENPTFKDSLKILKFVPTINGVLKSPNTLYDPRGDELYTLLEDSECFPCGPFEDPSVLDMLLPLGLRTSVSTDTVLQSARNIESMMHKDQSRAHARAKALLSYLEVHATKWIPYRPNDSNKKVNSMIAKVATALRSSHNMPPMSDLEKFWTELKMICWCPVLVSPPHPSLPWPVVSSMVAPPKQVRLHSDMWVVSASSRILDGECASSALSYILGWSIPPSGNVIAAQLLELGKNNEIVLDQALRQELALVMPKIYSLLTSLVGSDEMDIVKAVLEGSRWIWVGDGFAKIDEVVLTGQLHLAPFIRVIPVDLAVFRELLLLLGVKEYLNAVDYANILSRMAIRKDSSVLDTKELRMAVLIVQYLAEFRFQDLQVQIYLPDSSCRLCRSTDLVFNDAPWLLDSDDVSSAVSGTKKYVHNFVHGNISNDVAEKLGVRSLRRLLLAESSDSMNVTLSGVAEAFGQHEALTTRLKHIVEMYADGPGILFELVQNAEDAHASEVVFLLDKTQYGTSSILSPEMAEWQGPALYCFNDSVFTPQDLYAISRIGQDGKLEKPFSIGRFGLGFNCVYHFTDVPGFISGDNIVIFDPHAFYLPGISPSHPGLRIRFVGRRILDQFPDQFAPFLHFGCDLQQSYPGTLFRFPLRNENSAHRSQIKKEKYSPGDVESLFNSFSEVVPEALLFLRNVKKITMYVKEGPTQQMRLVHCVSRHGMGNTTTKEQQQQQNPMLNFVRGNRKNVMDRDQFFNKLSKTLETDLPWSCQKAAIVERTPASCSLHSWIMSECLGGGNAKRLSLESRNKSHNFSFIPWASVAAYLNSVKLKVGEELTGKLSTGEWIDDTKISQYKAIEDPSSVSSSDGKKKFEGRVFCFLPLPVLTGLPIHVNAYFELSSNRRDIWIGNDMAGGGKVRSEWNMALLEDVAAPAYARLLAAIAGEMGPTNSFLSFWPTTGGVEPWASMTRKLYSSIAELGLPVLHTKARGGQWISTRQSIFPDFSFSKASELAEALCEAGLPVISLAKPVVDKFMEVCPSLHYLKPHLLRNLLIRRKRGFQSRESAITALEYCLSDMGGPSFPDKLHGLPLVPLANGSLTVFNKRGEGERVFFTSEIEYSLLKDTVPHLLIDRSIPETVLTKLYDIADSGQSNICLFSAGSLAELFPRVLPPEWQRVKMVTWSPGQDGQPSVDWLRSLWSYLKESNAELLVLTEWPILPVTDNRLLRLAENSNVIRDEGWSENMHSLLEKLGCFFLRSDLLIEHPRLKYFVQESTATGVLNAVKSVARDSREIKELFAGASPAELHELRSFIFQSKWFIGSQISSSHTEVIKSLPIFEPYKSRELVGLINPGKWLKPEGVPEEILDESFIRTESDKETNILRSFLDIREPNKVEFYKNHVLSRVPEFVSRPALLSAILRDVKILGEGDSSLRGALSDTPFVSTASGAWLHPSRLYDPRVRELQSLLHKQTFFPSAEFMSPEILESLAGLGLKRTLSYTALIDSAKSVSLMHDSGKPDAVPYGQRLLFYLDALALKLSSSDVNGEDNTNGDHQVAPSFSSDFDRDLSEDVFWSEIKSISWCPVYIAPPFKDLPWFESADKIAAPAVTRPKSQIWLVSSQLRVLDGDIKSPYLEQKLGWLDSPDLKVLSTQLIELSRCYSNLKTNSEENNLFSIDTVLQKEISLIYSNLQGFISTKNDLKTLKEMLDGVSWVYIGDSFVSPKSLAFDSPVKYPPYLYVVPSELSEFRPLLSELGVRLTFDGTDYVNVLRQLHRDTKEEPLTEELLTFVRCLLEAFADSYSDRLAPDSLLNSLLIPDSLGILVPSRSLVYNDAPWMDSPDSKQFVHQSIGDDLAKRLGVQSLRGLSLVDEELVRDLRCMDYGKICELLALYGESDFVLFDILELADYCEAKKVRLIHDKRQHPRQSLLQHNLGDYQGSALTVVLEGTVLSQEEVCGLQLPPPWKVRGNSLRYGPGLVSAYFVCDLLTVLSDGYFYIFDPLGLTGDSPASNSAASSAKLFALKGTDLAERFHDQFRPMLVTEDKSLSSLSSTIIRMPLSSKYIKESEDGDCKKVKQIFDRFMRHSSSTLLSLKSVFQVSLSTWEDGSSQPTVNYSVLVDPSTAILRNPFLEKKWRKFQIKRLFNSSNVAIKMHAIDVQVIESGTCYVDKWVVVLSLGSGQTRNMALDRRYLAYNLTPVAGVAVHISRDGIPITVQNSSYILSPLPLSGSISMPVTTLGHFLTRHSTGRYIFCRTDDPVAELTESWNKELMLCVRDSYMEMVLEFQKLRKDPLSSSISMEPRSARSVSAILHLYGDKMYSFWPRSTNQPSDEQSDSSTIASEGAEWRSLIEQVIRPFYTRLADLPVWQLYGGNLVRVDEGMFLAQPGTTDVVNLPSPNVCGFIKEHYPVFSVPWELVREIQAVGINVREIRPRMVRNLLKSRSSVMLRLIDTYMDVLEYCMSDINEYRLSDLSLLDNNLNIPTRSETGSTSGGDALEIMTYFGKALYDLGRGVVDDISKGNRINTGDVSVMSSLVVDLKGVPFPTATQSLTRLGTTELWIGNEEQQNVMHWLADNFIHHKCLEKPVLVTLLSNRAIHEPLKLRPFSPQLISDHLRSLFDRRWVKIVEDTNSPWFSWDNTAESSPHGPSAKWVRSFWKVFNSLEGDVALVSNWPLVPAYLDRPVLCRVKLGHMVFCPPIANENSGEAEFPGSSGDDTGEAKQNRLLRAAFESVGSEYPWLFSLLNQFNIPIYDASFPESYGPCSSMTSQSQTLGHTVVSKLLANKNAGYLPEPVQLTNEDRDRLCSLFALDFQSSVSHTYQPEELDMLRELPIYKTVVGTYTSLSTSEHWIVSPTTFFHPNNEQCLSLSTNSNPFLHALGVDQLTDQQVLVRFALPGFENQTTKEQEDILLYLYSNWKDLQSSSEVINTLKETNFVKNATEPSIGLFKPKDLLDPLDPLLTSVFSEERDRFPGERFITDGWLRILKKTGLRTSSEPDIILECAKKVESIGNISNNSSSTSSSSSSSEYPDELEVDSSSTRNEVSLEMWSLAESVVSAIFTNFATLYSTEFCEKIGSIRFVPAERGFPSIGGKKGGKRVLCSYKDAILLQDWPLAWSSAAIITKQSVIPPEYSWSALKLRSPPTFSTVLKHLKTVGSNNGEDTLAHWPASTGLMTVENTFLEILQYLDKIWGTLSSSDKAELQKLAFVPVANGTRLVPAKSLFARLTINMSPFAFELPSQYLPFVNNLREIGMQETLTVPSAQDLLSNVQKCCGYQRLNPNELRAVMDILNFMSSSDRSQLSERVLDTVIPDDGCRLVSASSCVYVDASGSRFLASIDTSRLRFTHPGLPRNICTHLGIKKLSDVVVEELEEGLDLQVVSEVGSVPLTRIKDKLLSKSLHGVLFALINGITNHFPSFQAPGLSGIRDSLETTARMLQFVKRLHTRFLLLPKQLDITKSNPNTPAFPEWGNDRKHRTVHFINKSKTQILIAEPPSFLTTYDVLSLVISHVLGMPVVLPIGPLFACPDGSERETLKILKLGFEAGTSTHNGKGNSTLLGKDLLTQDAQQVQFLPLRPFYNGEIVAWKTRKEGEKLRYGKVPQDVRPAAGQAIYQIPVETGPGETEMLLSNRVFSFRSASMGDTSAGPRLSEDGRMDGGSSMAGLSPVGGRNGEVVNQGSKLQYGKVSASEVVQAIHDMLHVAGINFDAEKETLLQSTLSLQEELKESQVALLVEQEKAEAAIKEADTAKAAWSCRICLSTEVNIAMVPCGHVLCHRCSASVSRCPFCRSQVSRKMKIFRP